MKTIQLYGKRGIGNFALVDDEDYQVINHWRWQVSKHNEKLYATRKKWSKEKKKNVTVYMHRQIMNAQVGEKIDHHDRDTFNNQKINLRRGVTYSQNGANSEIRSDNTSGYKGVYKRNDLAHAETWYGIVTKDNKSYRTTSYRTAYEAAIARDILALELHKEFAALNFPHFKQVDYDSFIEAHKPEPKQPLRPRKDTKLPEYKGVYKVEFPNGKIQYRGRASYNYKGYYTPYFDSAPKADQAQRALVQELKNQK